MENVSKRIQSFIPNNTKIPPKLQNQYVTMYLNFVPQPKHNQVKGFSLHTYQRKQQITNSKLNCITNPRWVFARITYPQRKRENQKRKPEVMDVT